MLAYVRTGCFPWFYLREVDYRPDDAWIYDDRMFEARRGRVTLRFATVAEYFAWCGRAPIVVYTARL